METIEYFPIWKSLSSHIDLNILWFISGIPLYLNRIQWINYGELMYNMVTIVNKDVLYMWNFLREYVSSILPIQKVTMWGYG